MATKITLYKSYVDGQGAGASSYIQYPQHLDADHTAIEGLLDQVVDELTGLKGPNTLIGLDLTQINNDDGPYGTVLSGVIGEHSLWPTINGGDASLLDVAPGQAVVSSNRVAIPSGVQLDGAVLGGSPTTGYVAITSTGVITLESAADQKDMDIASMTWNGSIFTGTATQECEIFVDGDDLNLCLDRAAVGGATKTLPATDFRFLANRIGEIERLLAGIKTQLEGSTALGAIGFGGAVGSPGLMLTDGTTYDLTSGLYRPAANVLGVTISGTELLRFLATALRANADGSNANPFFSWVADDDTGMYRIDENRLGFATNALLRAELDAEGNLDLPTNSRVQGLETTFRDMTDSGSGHILEFTDADAYDIGDWHDVATNPEDEEFDCPTGGSGNYHLLFEFEFETGTATTHDVELYIMKNGSTIGTHEIATFKRRLVVNEDCAGSLSTYDDLVGGTDIIRVVARHVSTGAVNFGLNEYKLTITKVA
jgi:hypothetical protein